MPDVVQCPHCKREVSANAIDCQWCGTAISEVPTSVSVELLTSLLDEDLLGFLFGYAIKALETHGLFDLDGPSHPELLGTLPRGIRMGYTLILLKGEVDNGGFYQWFTNSSGKVVYETLDDLRLIGAMQHVRVVEKAIRLNERLEGKYLSYKRRWDWRSNSPDNAELEPEFWSDVDTNFMPEFDRLSSEIYVLEGGCGVEVVDGIERSCHIAGTDPLWIHFARFTREHAEEFVHHRG